MSLTDFLFNGSPPPATTSYGTTTSGLPAWYTDYAQGMMAKANSVASEPFQVYGGPRIAGATPDQTGAYAQTRTNNGSWTGGMNAANGNEAGAAAMNPYAAANGNLTSASQSGSSGMSNYMNPYTQDVNNNLAKQAGLNLSQNILPAIGSAYTQSGQFGSSRMQDSTGQAMQNTQQQLLGQQSQNLNSEFNNAATFSQNDLSRQAQIGQVQGNLTATGQQNLANIGTNQAAMAGQRQNYGLKDAASLDAIGQEQQGLTQQNLNTAYGDFQNQVQYPWQQLSNMNSILKGVQVPTSESKSQTGINSYAYPQSQTGLNSLVSGLSLLNGLK